MQDNVHKDYKDTPALWSMCWMNFWCSLYNCVYLFAVTSAGWDLLSFCREFPEVCGPGLAMCIGPYRMLEGDTQPSLCMFASFHLKVHLTLCTGCMLILGSCDGSQGACMYSRARTLTTVCRIVQAGLYILLFCLCGAVGQVFIFGTIRRFGSLVNTLICTTRKFFNILLSVLWSGNPLLPQQWVAVILVFLGLLTSSIAKRGKKVVQATVEAGVNGESTDGKKVE